MLTLTDSVSDSLTSLLERPVTLTSNNNNLPLDFQIVAWELMRTIPAAMLQNLVIMDGYLVIF